MATQYPCWVGLAVSLLEAVKPAASSFGSSETRPSLWACHGATERPIHPAGRRAAVGLPDESGVPVLVSGSARCHRESLSCQGALASADDLLDLRLQPAECAIPNPSASSGGVALVVIVTLALHVRTLCRRGLPGLRECANRLSPVVFQAGLKAGLCPAPAASGPVCHGIALLLAHLPGRWAAPPAHALGDGAKPPENRLNLPVAALGPVWQAAATMNESEKRFSFTRAASSTSERENQISSVRTQHET